MIVCNKLCEFLNIWVGKLRKNSQCSHVRDFMRHEYYQYKKDTNMQRCQNNQKKILNFNQFFKNIDWKVNPLFLGLLIYYLVPWFHTFGK